MQYDAYFFKVRLNLVFSEKSMWKSLFLAIQFFLSIFTERAH